MGSLSTFGTFTTARLGIFVAQHALNTTGNNISNINTKGYSRQQIDQTSMYYGSADRYQSRYDIRGNGGVLATGVNQLRDQYLDIRYRNEMTKVGQMKSKVGGLNEIGQIIDEVAKGEDGEGVLEARMNDFIQQLENLHVPENSNKQDYDSIVRSSAEAMVVQFNDYAKRLDALMQTKTTEFHTEIDGVNTTLEKIRDLNESIRRQQVFGGSALTQKDERNLLIDELSEKIGINVVYEMEDLGDGVQVEKLKISTSGDPERLLINGIYGAQLSVMPKNTSEEVTDENGRVVNEWQGGDNENFNLMISELEDSRGKKDPSAPNALETVYELKMYGKDQSDWSSVKESVTTGKQAEIEEIVNSLNEQFGYTQGTVPYFHADKATDDPDSDYVVHYHYFGTTDEEKAANYSFVNVKELRVTKLGDTELTGGLQAMRELLTESGEYSDADSIAKDDLRYDPDAGVKRGIPYYQKALDTLANTFARLMNEANTMQDKEIFETDGTGSLKQDSETNMYVPRHGFEKYFEQMPDSTEDNPKYKADPTDPSRPLLKEEYKQYMGGPLFSNGNNSNETTGITAGNIAISKDWADKLGRVLRSKSPNAPEQSDLQENQRHMISVLTNKHDFTTASDGEDADAYFQGTLQEMLTDIIAGTLAKDQNITETMLNNYNVTADELYVDRDSVMGVDLNDEAMNMMQFQKAYSAACRLMTTYDDMLERLINGTAV